MITASIVTYNTNSEDLKRLLTCLLKSSVNHVIIIDQSSDNRLKSILPQTERIEYIHTVNRGYGAAHNIAIKKSLENGSDYHLVLNPDVYWTEDVILPLKKFMDLHPECGLVMPKVLYPDGRVQYLCKRLPSPWTLIIRRFVKIRALQEWINNKYEMRSTGYDHIMEVPVLSGCFMFLRCSTLRRAGMFDERFFLYGEDVDLCRRIGEISSPIFYPLISIYHSHAKSSYNDKTMLNIHIQSMIKYFNKWGWFFEKK